MRQIERFENLIVGEKGIAAIVESGCQVNRIRQLQFCRRAPLGGVFENSTIDGNDFESGGWSRSLFFPLVTLRAKETLCLRRSGKSTFA